FSGKIQSPERTLHRIKLTGHDYRGQQWRFSTQANWEFSGSYVPSIEGQQQLTSVVSQLHTLFGSSVSLPR
ncbi:MAG: hypothetical protein AAGC93_22300, partial [Cyanobacteria bacterium P01_F01_bin.53]